MYRDLSVTPARGSGRAELRTELEGVKTVKQEPVGH